MLDHQSGHHIESAYSKYERFRIELNIKLDMNICLS